MGENGREGRLRGLPDQMSGTSRPAAIIDQGLGDRDWGCGLVEGALGTQSQRAWTRVITDKNDYPPLPPLPSEYPLFCLFLPCFAPTCKSERSAYLVLSQQLLGFSADLGSSPLNQRVVGSSPTGGTDVKP